MSYCQDCADKDREISALATRVGDLEEAWSMSEEAEKIQRERAEAAEAEAREMADKNFRNYEGRLKAEARVKELVERRNRLIQEKYEAEARCERMRGLAQGEHKYRVVMGKFSDETADECWDAHLASGECPVCRELVALDTDTTAGNPYNPETHPGSHALHETRRDTTAGEQG